MDYYPQGIVQLSQTAAVVAVGLLIVGVFGRRVYPPRGWLWRTGLLLLTFTFLGAVDLWLNEGAGGPLDYHGVGTGLHYWVLVATIATTLGVGFATFRAHRRARGSRPDTGAAREAAH